MTTSDNSRGSWPQPALSATLRLPWETRPQASLEIYREQAERLVEARARNSYRQACIYLAKMRDLYRRVSQESAWTGVMVGFRERHRGLSALQDELNNAGL